MPWGICFPGYFFCHECNFLKSQALYQTESCEESAAAEEQPAEEAQSGVAAETDEVETQESSGEQEAAVGQGQLRELTTLSEMPYENYGSAYGGVMPVMQDGLWGIADYEGNLIVPCEYEGFYAAPDKMGNMLLDKEGNIIYQGTDEVRASGGMYIAMHRGDESDQDLREGYSVVTQALNKSACVPVSTNVNVRISSSIR